MQLVWENRKLDKVHGSNKNRVLNQPGEGQESEVGEENYGPTFRVRTFWTCSSICDMYQEQIDLFEFQDLSCSSPFTMDKQY